MAGAGTACAIKLIGDYGVAALGTMAPSSWCRHLTASMKHLRNMRESTDNAAPAGGHIQRSKVSFLMHIKVFKETGSSCQDGR